MEFSLVVYLPGFVWWVVDVVAGGEIVERESPVECEAWVPSFDF